MNPWESALAVITCNDRNSPILTSVVGLSMFSLVVSFVINV